MPAIKKKWIKANQGGVNGAETTENNSEAHSDVQGDEDKELAEGEMPPKAVTSPIKAKKRPLDPTSGGMLRGLDGEVLAQKRKRFVPPAELKLNEWLESHLEKRNDVKVSLVQLYKYYTELCQGDASDILDVTAFNRMIKAKFGKTFGIKETSVYKAVLREHKLDEQKRKASAGYKLKEIAHEAINHFGNPWSGVRFFGLKQYVATKYPFLQIDQRPKVLKRILEMGVNYGQIDLVKGIGMAGFYRLPGAKPDPPKAKTGKEEKKNVKDAEGSEDAPEADSAGSDAQEPKEKGDSAETGDKESKENVDEQKKQKPKKTEKCNLNRIRHGDPKKIEDTFPLAITFQSAPKTASIIRIRRYIQDHYKETVADGRWRKAVESGADKGHWEYISGSGITGRLHLLMDDFDPDSEHLEDMICAGIIACHEPKAASGNQIKKYVSRYHPDFHVDNKPDRFKKALIRAAEKNMIVQVSGLGANGSFQLVDTFVPSPRVLSGENAASDDEEENESSDEEPVYIPKGTKSRNLTKKSSVAPKQVAKKPRPMPKRASPTTKQAKKKAAKTASPKPKSKSVSPVKVSPKRKVGKSRRSSGKEDSLLDTSFDDEEKVEYTPKKSKSRGGSVTPVNSSKKVKKTETSKSRTSNKKAKSSPLVSEEEEEEEEVESEVEYTPRKSQSRGGPARNKEERTPKKEKKKSGSPSKGVKSPKGSISKSDATESRASSRITKSGLTISIFKMNIDNGSDAADEDSEVEAPVKKTPPGSAIGKEKKGKKKGKKRR